MLHYLLPLLKSTRNSRKTCTRKLPLDPNLVRFLVRFSRAISRALLSIFSCKFSCSILSIFSCKFSCSTFDFLVQFLVLYFRFSRAISGALLSIFSCNFWFSLYSRALLSIFSCNFSCSTFDFLVQFLVRYFRFSRAISCATVTEISRQKKKKHEKKRTTGLFQNKSKPVEMTTSHFVSGQFFNSALYVSCGGRCM